MNRILNKTVIIISLSAAVFIILSCDGAFDAAKQKLLADGLILSGAVNTFAGSGTAGFTDGTGTSATFNQPWGITSDGTNLYVTEFLNHSIRKVVIATGAVTTLAGTGSSGSTDGTGTAASFNYPEGITTDGLNLYVCDSANNKLRKVVISTGEVTTFAGTGTAASVDGTGTSASLNNPSALTTDGTNLYVVDWGSSNIRKIVITTAVVTTIAGAGSAGSSDGTGTAASFSSPEGIVTDGVNLYVSDSYNYKIRKIVISTGVVTTFAGTGSAASVDGTGTSASFNRPGQIIEDGVNLYVTDRYGYKIRKIVISTGVVTTVAGSGTAASVDGTGASASFNLPTGIASDGIFLYVADTNGYKIRVIQ